MKINYFLTAISVLMSALLGYLAFSVANGDEFDTLCGFTSGICFLCALMPILGMKYDDSKIRINISIASSLFLMAFLVVNFCFAAVGVCLPYYLILNGLLLLILLLVVYKIVSIEKY